MDHRRGCRSNHGIPLMVRSARPMTITWLSVSALGLSNTGFSRACGVMRAASACRYCARPISAPSSVTAALLLIFCALKGATRTPRLARWRHRAVTTNDLPASLEQPMIMMGGAIISFLRPPHVLHYVCWLGNKGYCFGSPAEGHTGAETRRLYVNLPRLARGG